MAGFEGRLMADIEGVWLAAHTIWYSLLFLPRQVWLCTYTSISFSPERKKFKKPTPLNLQVSHMLKKVSANQRWLFP